MFSWATLAWRRRQRTLYIDDEGWLHSRDIGRLDKVSCVLCILVVLIMYCTLYRMVSYTSLVALRVRGGYI